MTHCQWLGRKHIPLLVLLLSGLSYLQAAETSLPDLSSDSGLPPGYVRGDVVSYSYVPNRYWSRSEAMGVLPYLCEYSIQKHNDAIALETFHKENIRRIDMVSRWSTAIMLYPRKLHYRDEIINLMVRCFKNRQLIILRVYWSPRGDKEFTPFEQAIDLLDTLWSKRNEPIYTPEGDCATGRQLINNILLIKLGDEGLGAFGTEGLELVHRTFYEKVRNRTLDGEQPFKHIKAWYNMIGYWNGCYAASQTDLTKYKRRKIPSNAEFIGTDVYHYWGLDWAPFDPYGPDVDRSKVQEVVDHWHSYFTKYYPEGLEMVADKEHPSPTSQNETHAMMGAIDLAKADRAMMFFIGGSSQIESYTYTTPIETMDLLYDNLKAGPWVGLSWWLFDDFSDMGGTIHYVDQDLMHYTKQNPKGEPYRPDQAKALRAEFLASRIRMFEDTVYNQFGHLNPRPK